jgi:hypothetical protein
MRILLTGLFLCIFLPLHAQMTMAFMPEVQGRTLDGIYKVRIGNTGSRQNVSMTITVTESKSGIVVTLKTPSFELMPGVNNIPANAVYNAITVFGQNKLATVVSQSGFFPAGDYDYCFQLFDGTTHSSNLLAEQCFNYDLQPFSSLQLIQPYDEDKICDKRPTFSWQPLIPAVVGVRYRMQLVEIKEGQQRAEAIRMNIPLINQLQIPLPVLLYPSMNSELVEGKRYAWQVAAYRNDLLLVESEIWDFRVECEKDSSTVPSEAFRNLEDLSKGNFYIARGKLLFAFNNTYEASTLEYTIQCLTKPEQQIKKLPKIKVFRGRNQVTIDLSDNRSFTDGYFYIMNVKLPDGEEKNLRFIYKTAE